MFAFGSFKTAFQCYDDSLQPPSSVSNALALAALALACRSSSSANIVWSQPGSAMILVFCHEFFSPVKCAGWLLAAELRQAGIMRPT